MLLLLGFFYLFKKTYFVTVFDSFSFACLFCIVIILVYMYAHYCTINVTVTLFKRNKEYTYMTLIFTLCRSFESFKEYT